MSTSLNSPLPLRLRRGAASVEMALTMLVFVPVFLYAIFLDDLQRHAMDVQEAVISTVWDFTGQDYTPASEGGPSSGYADANAQVQHQARLTYCDHQSGLDSFNPSAPECRPESQDHHKAVAGHVCWMHPGAWQVTCEGPRRDVGALTEATYSRYGDEHQRLGGMFRCSARAAVNNYLLPKQFLPEFSKTDLSKHNWKTSAEDIHKNAETANKDRAYYLAAHHAALVTDSWALTPGDAVEPATQAGPYFERVRTVFERNPAFEGYRRSAEALRTGFVRQRLLVRDAGDSMTAPRLAYSPVGSSTRGGSPEPTTQVQQEGRATPYFSSPWRDWDGDRHAKTYEARGAYDLGCTSPDCRAR